MRDVLPQAEMVLFAFLEAPCEMSESEVMDRLAKISDDAEIQQALIRLLLWHGVLGFQRNSGEPEYIHSSGYDMRRFLALIEKRREDGLVYIINPAFWKGLEICE